MKIPILGTGLSGLVGSRVVELLSHTYDFKDLSFDTGVDITQEDVVMQRFSESQATSVLHMAAKTDVDSCEKDKELGTAGPAWKINVEGTRNIVKAATAYNKRVIYISTDFVFDGKNEANTESDKPNPINWYGVTKYEGEKIILQNPENIIIRITYPYCAKNTIKKDFVHTIIERLQKREKVLAMEDHIFTPTFIDDIAELIDTLIHGKQGGIYHAVGSSSLTPYEAAVKIAHVFNLSSDTIEKTTLNQYFKDRALRPFCLRTKNAKISSLGVNMHSFSEGLEEIKKQGID